MQEKSCGIIPVRFERDKHRYLLIQHHAGHWGFPKGHQNKGESNIETAVRELEEETGLRLKKIYNDQKFIEQYTFHRAGNTHSKKVVYFFGVVAPGPVKIQEEEIKDYAWLTYLSVVKKIKFPEMNRILEAIEERITQELKSSEVE